MSDWENGFCDCCGSCSDCLIAWLCPCIHAYMASQAAGQDKFCGIYQCVLYPLCVPFLRKEIRESKDIEGNVFKDLAAGWCCPCCATIQIKREYD